MSNLTVTPAPDQPQDPSVVAPVAVLEPQAPYVPDVSPAALPSPLDGLRAKLASVTLDLHVDKEVPRWLDQFGIAVFVRYGPLSPAYASKVAEEFEKASKSAKGVETKLPGAGADWSIQANAQMLVESCKGVYAVDPADPETKMSLRPGDPNGAWTKFDPDLMAFLGNLVTDKSAIGICRALYLTDGDLTVAAAELSTWSMKSSEDSASGFPTP